MGKYIIEIPEDKIADFVGSTHFLMPYMMAGHKGHHDTGLELTPYTEPDLGQVRKEAYKIGYEKGYRDGANRIGDAEDKIRKEAYQKGYETGYEDGYNEPGKNQQEAYQRGLADAWETARTLWNTPNRKEIFGNTTFNTVLTTLTAQEAIEKIRQYEQEKQEKDAEIKVGKEFQMGERKCVVTHIIDGTQRRVLWDNGVSGLVDNTDLFGNLTPTGRYFPEIAAVLDKMRENT